MHELFPGQQENEEIHLVIREHWFYLLSKLLVWFVFVIFFVLLDKYLPQLMPNIVSGPYTGYFNLFKNLVTMFLALGLLMIWALYYLNIQIITNKRIVDVSQDNLFSHTVSELDLSRIEDVTAETRGLFGTVFNFGNVYVQTAGTVDRFEFSNIPHPDKVEKMILDLSQTNPAA